MNKLSDENFAVLAALLVLFSALLNPVVSVVLAVSLLLLYAPAKWLSRARNG